jgi:hypothetical protein
LPATYNLLLSDNRADLSKVVTRTQGAKSVADLAARAYALASLNRIDEAKSALSKATAAIKTETGRDVAILYIANLKTVEMNSPAAADAVYADADADLQKIAPGFVFSDIAIARFKIQQRSYTEAKVLLNSAAAKGPTAAEDAAIKRLLRQVEAKR